MRSPSNVNGERNCIAHRLWVLRKGRGWPCSRLACALQLVGLDMGQGAIGRVEKGGRFVTDIELRALAKVFGVSYAYLIDGEEE